MKVFDGADGAKGDPGSRCRCIYVFLTNESHTFPASPTGVVDSSFAAGASQVRVFGKHSI